MRCRAGSLLLSCGVLACSAGGVPPAAPELINSHAVFAPACDRVVYSSNRDGLFRPFALESPLAARPRLRALRITEPRDFVARSLAADCRRLALVADEDGKGVFDVYLYDLETDTLENLTRSPEVDDGDPVFAPVGTRLAFLSDRALVLHDPEHGTTRELRDPTLRLRSLAWAPDAETLYLEDAATNLWAYAVAARELTSVWQAPRRSYSGRMLAPGSDSILFVSDHEDGVAQVYEYGLATGELSRLWPSPHDQYSPEKLGPGHYAFRTNLGGRYVAAEVRSGALRLLPPQDGVVYAHARGFSQPLVVYASDAHVTSLYRMEGPRAHPLVPMDFAIAQRRAVPVVNRAGMTNFLYLPEAAPRGWVLWLHGGPFEEVSPRFNPYIDLLNRLGLAVAAINYPGSTGLGNAYELRGVDAAERSQRELAGLEEDLAQIEALHPGIRAWTLLGVSYGSGLAHRFRARHPGRVERLVDFSGTATLETLQAEVDPDAPTPPALFLYGENDYALRLPGRRQLIEAYAARGDATVLVLEREGHFVKRRPSIDGVLRALADFLETPPQRAPAEARLGIGPRAAHERRAQRAPGERAAP